MKYYKLINASEFIGVGTTYGLRRFQHKHQILLACDEYHAQYIQCNDELYKDTWMVPDITDEISYTELQVIEISKDEYDVLYEAMENSEDVEVPDENPAIEEPPTETDPVEEITLDYVITQKVNAMSKKCEETILNGFSITLSDGKEHHFSLSDRDQMMISKLADKAAKGETFLPWHPDDGDCTIFAKEDIFAMNEMMEAMITYHLTYFNSLKKYIMSMTDINDVQQVQYGIEIPLEYQTEVLQILLAQQS